MKERIEQIFKEYRNMKNELLVLEFQLSNFHGVSDNDVIEGMCFSKPIGDRVQSSDISDKTAKVAINYKKVADKLNDEFYSALFDQYKTLISEIDFFEYCIKQLSGKLPDVMSDLYMNKLTWVELEDKYHVSHTMISKYKKKAINEMVELYIAREKQIAKYILS